MTQRCLSAGQPCGCLLLRLPTAQQVTASSPCVLPSPLRDVPGGEGTGRATGDDSERLASLPLRYARGLLQWLRELAGMWGQPQ